MKLSTPASSQCVFLEKLTLDEIAQHPVKGLILKNLLKDFDSKSCDFNSKSCDFNSKSCDFKMKSQRSL